MICLTMISKFNPAFQKISNTILVIPIGEARELEETVMCKRVGNFLAHMKIEDNLLPNQINYPLYFDENNDWAIKSVNESQ